MVAQCYHKAMTKFTTVNEYIKAQPQAAADRLTAIRELFHEVLPESKESISYDIIAFSFGRQRLYFSGYKDHIGMYPLSEDIPELNVALAPYRGKGTKNALHFKHTQPLPLDVIKQIILHTNNEA